MFDVLVGWVWLSLDLLVCWIDCIVVYYFVSVCLFISGVWVMLLMVLFVVFDVVGVGVDFE